MSAKVFVDTNILVYARDSSEKEKQITAKQWMAYLWQTRLGRLSYQSCNEYYVITTQRLKPGLSRKEARDDINAFEAWNPLAINQNTIENAWRIQDKYQFSWWYSLILSAAQIQSCTFILSEDLQHEQAIDELRIINPFLSDLSRISDYRLDKII